MTIWTTLGGVREGYRSGWTPSRVVDGVLAGIEASDDPAVWIDLVPVERLRAEAAGLDALVADDPAVLDRLPLLGVPCAVKGNIDVDGLPTTAACPGFGRVAEADAEAVRLLRAAGALVVGTTNLDQFATGLVGTRSPYGTPRNTLDGGLVPGGSSSGSAAAVAAGLVTFALGTDTAGSGRVPAALQGIVGLKPTRGLVSTAGVVPACRSLDCVSVFARTVADAADVLAVLARFDPADPWSRRAPGPASGTGRRPRVALADPAGLDFFGDDAMREAYLAAAARWTTVGTIDVAPLVEAGALLYRGPWVAERLADLADFLAKHPVDVLPVTRGILEGGEAFTAVDAFRAQHRLAELAATVRTWWDDVDAVLLPTVGTTPTLAQVEAEPLAHNATLGHYTQHTNLLDLCALSVPAGLTADGRPVGLMLVGPAFGDALLTAAATDGEGEGTTTVAVAGKHLSGEPRNGELVALGATLAETTTTAGRYRLLALPPHDDPLPALVRVAAGDGSAVEVELWRVPDARVADLVRLVPRRLCLGHVELADGRQVLGFLGEAYAVEDCDAVDLTAGGGWRHRTRDTEKEEA